MCLSFSDHNVNSVEILPGLEARAAFTVNSVTVFCVGFDNLGSEMCNRARHFYCEVLGLELFMYDYEMGPTITCSASSDPFLSSLLT